VEWFRPGEHERVERVLADLQSLNVRDLRTGFSWADWHTPAGHDWYDWLLPRLARQAELLLCFSSTPPSLGLAPKTSAPPANPKDYADFLDRVITRYSKYFEWLELWNEPNNIGVWDWRLDPEWKRFCEMVGTAAFWARHRGKKTVLSGTGPADLNWLDLMGRRGVLRYMDAVGVRGFPGIREGEWEGWPVLLARFREVLERYELRPELWIAEAGYSTWRHDEFNQLREFREVLDAPAQRAYWYAAQDLHPELPHSEGFHQDERHYHFGLTRSDGSRKLLHRIWSQQGLEGVREVAACGTEPRRWEEAVGPAAARSASEPPPRRPILIFGGAGFLGTNLAHRLMSLGKSVLVFDNLSRPGAEKNLQWLRHRHPKQLHMVVADLRDIHTVRRAVRYAERVFHLAVRPESEENEEESLEVNVQGTVNLLEALRDLPAAPPLVVASGYQVYGTLRGLELRDNYTRYEPADRWLQCNGINEKLPLDFSSPQACSQGAADQYVLAYARRYRIPAVVLRLGCVYGPRQTGMEEDGWVTRILLKALRNETLVLTGDGKQVRDILFADDAVNALLYAQKYLHALQGRAYNIGGGPMNTTSCNELVNLIANLNGAAPEVVYRNWLPDEARYYVSDINAFRAITGWTPLIGVREGIGRLYQWHQERKPAEPGKAVAEKAAFMLVQ